MNRNNGANGGYFVCPASPPASPPVCLGPAKVSLKYRLDEVNIVHLTAAMEGALTSAKMRLPKARIRRWLPSTRSSRSFQTQVHGVRPVCHRLCTIRYVEVAVSSRPVTTFVQEPSALSACLPADFSQYSLGLWRFFIASMTISFDLPASNNCFI
jgi:hypothetical protein